MDHDLVVYGGQNEELKEMKKMKEKKRRSDGEAKMRLNNPEIASHSGSIANISAKAFACQSFDRRVSLMVTFDTVTPGVLEVGGDCSPDHVYASAKGVAALTCPLGPISVTLTFAGQLLSVPHNCTAVLPDAVDSGQLSPVLRYISTFDLGRRLIAWGRGYLGPIFTVVEYVGYAVLALGATYAIVAYEVPFLFARCTRPRDSGQLLTLGSALPEHIGLEMEKVVATNQDAVISVVVLRADHAWPAWEDALDKLNGTITEVSKEGLTRLLLVSQELANRQKTF
jgi:hypothetical protein